MTNPTPDVAEHMAIINAIADAPGDHSVVGDAVRVLRDAYEALRVERDDWRAVLHGWTPGTLACELQAHQAVVSALECGDGYDTPADVARSLKARAAQAERDLAAAQTELDRYHRSLADENMARLVAERDLADARAVLRAVRPYLWSSDDSGLFVDANAEDVLAKVDAALQGAPDGE